MEGKRSNIEIMRESLDAYKRRDRQAVLETLDPDVELFPIRAVLEGVPYRGHDGFLRFLDDMSEDWENFGLEDEILRELGEHTVLVLATFRARGKASGVEIETRAAWVCDLRDGKLVRLRFYSDEEAALEAAAENE